MTATATVTMLGEPYESASLRQHRGVKVGCSECSHMVFTGGPVDRDWSHSIDDHLRQHEPGRAIDIEVQYVLSADCTVCDDGGDLHEDSTDVIECRDCGTTWYSDGTGGETKDAS